MSYRVLVVDDDLSLAEMIQEELTDRGFLCEVSSSAEHATQLLETKGYEIFDSILCDFKMPGKNGLELLASFQNKGELIPFVLLTGFGDHEMAERAMAAGSFDFMRKPFNSSELVRSLTLASEWGRQWNAHRKQFTDFFGQKENNTPQKRQLIFQIIKSGKSELVQKFIDQHKKIGRAL